VERRRNQRRIKHVQVRFWRRSDPTPQSGYTTDISPTGMFITTNNPLTSGERLRVEVLDRDCSFMIETVVARSAKVDQHLQAFKKSGMGVRFMSIDELVGDLLRGGKAGPVDEEAPPKNGIYPVRYPTPEAFVQAYKRDISTGGLFVATRYPAELDSRIVVEIHLPATGPGEPPPPMRFPARVVQRFSPVSEGGVGTNLMSGMGVELTDRPSAIGQLAPIIQLFSRTSGSPSGTFRTP
jgi:hypothetical protein